MTYLDDINKLITTAADSLEQFDSMTRQDKDFVSYENKNLAGIDLASNLALIKSNLEIANQLKQINNSLLNMSAKIPNG